jgi:hypothetical protein
VSLEGADDGFYSLVMEGRLVEIYDWRHRDIPFCFVFCLCLSWHYGDWSWSSLTRLFP